MAGSFGIANTKTVVFKNIMQTALVRESEGFAHLNATKPITLETQPRYESRA